MLLAYVDEIGEIGAFVDKYHPKFNTSPAFGYAGFLLHDYEARSFGAYVTKVKRTVFAHELKGTENVGTWEKKGSEIFNRRAVHRTPHELKMFDKLVAELRKRKGYLFYLAEEKPLGTPKQTQMEPTERRKSALKQMTNRLARHAHQRQENLLIFMDAVQEKERKQDVQSMYAHILGRSAEYNEMRRILEPPAHLDSHLSSNIQFADWVAAFVTRAIEHQLIQKSPYGWITDRKIFSNVYGGFTYESKLRLWNRNLEDLHHSQVLKNERVVWPDAKGTLVANHVDSEHARRMRGIAEASARQQTENREGKLL